MGELVVIYGAGVGASPNSRSEGDPDPAHQLLVCQCQGCHELLNNAFLIPSSRQLAEPASFPKSCPFMHRRQKPPCHESSLQEGKCLNRWFSLIKKKKKPMGTRSQAISRYTGLKRTTQKSSSKIRLVKCWSETY